MSTREMAYSLIDELTDEQVTALLGFINSMLYAAPDNRAEISDEEILKKLEEAEEDIKAGRTCSFDELKEHIGRRRNELRS